MAERFLYLPMAGFSMLTVMGFEWISDKLNKNPESSPFGLASVAIAIFDPFLERTWHGRTTTHSPPRL